MGKDGQIKVGRPLKLNLEDLTKDMENYFKSITKINMRTTMVSTGELDDDGNMIMKTVPVTNDLGEPIYDRVWLKRPSVIEMAHYCGTTKNLLWEYEKRPEFKDTIKNAKEFIESYLEGKLEGSNVTGVIFNLKNNFGWTDAKKVELEVDVKKLEELLNDDD